MSNLSYVMSLPVRIPKAIPNEWKWKSLVDICNPKQWKTISNSKLTETGYPVFGANGFIGFYHDYNHEAETIAVTCRGATCGTVNLIPPKAYITGNSMCLDNVNSEVHLRYLFYATEYRTLSDTISGSAQPQITGEGLKFILLPVPPLPEQKKIASILTSVDEVIENTRAQINKLQDLKKALMQDLLTKGIGHTKFKDSELGQIPEGWELKALSALADYHNGRAFKPKEWSKEGLPIVRIAQMNNPFQETDHYGGSDILEKHRIRKGDLIFSWSATLKVILWKEYDAILNQHIFKVEQKRDVSKEFLQQLIDYSIEKLAKTSHGSTMKHIKKGVLDEYHSAVPPLPEQKKIASILTSVDEMIENTQAQINKFRSLKKALMKDLLTGKVRVTS